MRRSAVGAAYIDNIWPPPFTLDAAPTELAAGGMRWATKDLAPTEHDSIFFETFAAFCSMLRRTNLRNRWA
jgi:hypothetical protein